LAYFLQVLYRVFPFYRGLFEDKVANFWCGLDMLFKLRSQLEVWQLARLCLLTTLAFRQAANA
jgi:alpha-1,3-glucosyltransferase